MPTKLNHCMDTEGLHHVKGPTQNSDLKTIESFFHLHRKISSK